MAWEPDTEEIRLSQNKSAIEALRADQIINNSSINANGNSSNMGSLNGQPSFSTGQDGDVVQEVFNNISTVIENSVSYVVGAFETLGSLFTVKPSATNEPTANCATVKYLTGAVNGQKVTLKPQATKSLCLIHNPVSNPSTIGNLFIGSDITLTDTEVITLRFTTELLYTDYKGVWIVESTGSGSGNSTSGVLKDPVKVATTANVTNLTFSSPIDGIAMTVGDRFLVKDQTAQEDNGIYIWANGSASTRSSDMSGGSVQKEGTMTYVQDGLTQNERLYAINIGGNNILIGTNPNTWGEIGSGSGGGSGSIKSPVKVATTADVTSWTYNNGTGTLTASGNGVVVIDGITLAVNNRILVKDQSPANENGIYSVTTAGAVGATLVLTRSTDMSTGSTIEGGTMVYVTDGTVNGDNLFGLTTEGTVTVGTGNQAWANLTGGGWVGTATSDLNMNTFNINGLDQLIFSSATSTDLPAWNVSDYGMEVSGGTTPTGLDYRIPSLKAHKFLVNTTKIAEINSVSLDMNAHKITGVQNPSSPQDAMTLDYFNTNGIWLELDGSTTMTGHINAGNYNLINVNDILTTRNDGTARLQTTGGTATSDFVGLYLSTNTDYFLRQGTDYIFEWDKSDGEFTIFTDVVLGDATTDRITFNAKSASILDMNANKITGVQNPSNPTDVVTLDYFNSTGDTQWLELDGTGTMTGNINAGNNNLINVNDILTTRQDGTSRLITSGGTSTSNFVGLTLATGTDYYLRKSASDGSGYVFEWDNSSPSFKLSVPTIIDSTLQVNGNITLGNANTDTITFTAKSATELNMDAHKITGVLNPTNPTDVVTLDYFNSTGDTQWLELDGTGTMTGNINVGNNNINNVNAVNVVRSDSTARMAIQAGTGATTQVLFDAVTDVDVRFTEGLADRFEIQNSTNTIRSHVDLNMEGNNISNLVDINFSSGASMTSNASGVTMEVPTGDYWFFKIGSTNEFYIDSTLFRIYNELDMNNQKIVSVGYPTVYNDVATKQYVDANSGASGANDTLSNLSSPIAINQTLLPNVASGVIYSLGSSSAKWRNVFTTNLGFGTSAMAMPTNSGSNGEVLTTNGSSALSWTAVSGGWVGTAGSQLNMGAYSIIGAWGGTASTIGIESNLDMGNFNITKINQLSFYETNQTITDNSNGMRFSLPDIQDTYDFSIDGNEAISIEKYVLQLTNSRIGMTEEIAPPAPSSSSENLVYVDSTSHHLTIRHSTGTPVDLESGGSSGATVALDNLSSPTLNVNINANSKAITNLSYTRYSAVSLSPLNGTIWYYDGELRGKSQNGGSFIIEGSGSGPTLSADQTWTGTNTFMGSNATTVFKTNTNTSTAYTLQLIQNANSPQDNRTLANIDFMAENSSSQDEIYARISASSQDITNGTEDGLLQLGVMSGGTLVSGIDIEGGNNNQYYGAKIGFFGKTPVARQSVSTSASNSQIVTALKNLGLFY